MPVDGYFEWKAIKGMKQALRARYGRRQAVLPRRHLGEPRRSRQSTRTEQRTFAIITCTPNDLVATIHDRMPVVLHEKDYARWLGEDPDPAELRAAWMWLTISVR